jgi:hypothetical protein
MDTLSTAYAFGSVKQNASGLPINQPTGWYQIAVLVVHFALSI